MLFVGRMEDAGRHLQRERSSSSMSEVEAELADIDLNNKKKTKPMLSRQRYVLTHSRHSFYYVWGVNTVGWVSFSLGG